MGKRERLLFDENHIKKVVKRMGEEITNAYDGPIIAISILRGSFVFAADLIREIKLPVNVDFMTTSSYGDNMETTGKVQILHDTRSAIEGQDVLIIDDICDSGFTLEAIVNHIKLSNPKSVRTAVFLDKPSRRMTELYPDFVGETIDDLFIVGYGLNYGDFYRNTPYIFTFEEDDE